MKRTIFRQTWAIVVGVATALIASLIVNSLTEWWTALANITNAGWVATSEVVAEAITYRIPIWVIVFGMVLVALMWYLGRRISGASKTSTPDFFNYRQDTFEGVLCRWSYTLEFRGTGYEIENIQCFCQHCDFFIGTPNRHEQKCPSCSRRAVKSNNAPFNVGQLPWRNPQGTNGGENNMSFQKFS